MTQASIAQDIAKTQAHIINLEQDLKGFLTDKKILIANPPAFAKGLFFQLEQHRQYLAKMQKLVTP